MGDRWSLRHVVIIIICSDKVPWLFQTNCCIFTGPRICDSEDSGAPWIHCFHRYDTCSFIKTFFAPSSNNFSLLHQKLFLLRHKIFCCSFIKKKFRSFIKTFVAGSLRMMNVNFLYMLLQGSHYTPNLMMSRVVEFLQSYKTVLTQLVNNGRFSFTIGPNQLFGECIAKTWLEWNVL